MMWVNVNINKNQIKYDTGKASLIKFPQSKRGFWLTDKLIRTGKHTAALNIGINTEFKYLVDDKTKCSGEYIINAFKNVIVSSKQKPLLFKEHKPERIHSDVKPDASLYK